MTAVPEPVIPQQLQGRELPRIGPITPLTPRLQPGVRRSLQYARIAQAEIEAGVPPPDYLPAPVVRPRIGPITPLTRPEPIVVPGKGITIEPPASVYRLL